MNKQYKFCYYLQVILPLFILFFLHPSVNAQTYLTCPNHINVSADVDACSAVVDYDNPQTFLNDTLAQTVTVMTGTDNLPSSSNFPIGQTVLTFNIDYKGNADDCSFTVTVIDNQAPVLECSSDIEVNTAPDACSAAVHGLNPNVTENCPGTTVLLTSNLGNDDTFPVGVTIVSYSATDAAGNADDCSFTVTVIDAEVPIAICPSEPLVIALDATGHATLPENALTGNSTDNCIGLTQSSPALDFNCDSALEQTVTLTVTDAANNVNTVECNVVINNTAAFECFEDYCSSNGESTESEWINRIRLGEINNTSGNNGGYADFTDISTNLQQGQYYVFRANPGYNNCYQREYWRMWIDWNQDGDFSDSGERIFSRRRYGSFSKKIYIPANAMLGETRMRISMKHGGWPQACQDFAYGETEDYTINVNGNGGSRQSPITVFHAEKDEQQSELWWVNNHGTQVESFELERSADGVNFETIKSETDVVKSNEMTRYLHMDAQPMKGDNHYRLLVKYDDGDAEYTEVHILRFTDIGNYGVYPNPADEYVMLNLADFVDGAADIKIIDAYGKARYQQRVDLIGTEAIRIDLTNFIDGVYFINVVVEGKRMVSKKLMINKLYGWR